MLINTLVRTAVLLIAAGVLAVAQTPGRREISGVYPHLAMFNGGNECGTGAVVPWADRLWVVTYAPHQPLGSDDKLYEIDPALNQIVRLESIGGTPANRMIHRWRLPRGHATAGVPSRPVRVDREVSTERDLLSAGGIFYELPSNNAGGIAMVRPIATHTLDIDDYCSWRGLMVMSAAGAGSKANDRLVGAKAGAGALWLGVSDDLWQLGKARGEGGPWRNTAVRAGEPSDPYLMTGFSEKTLRLSHDRPAALGVRVDIDLTGSGLWVPYATFNLPAGRTFEHRFPDGFNAYWVRAVALADARVTALLDYR